MKKKLFLEGILTRNIISMMKGLKISFDHKIIVSITKFKIIQVTAHQNKFVGIYADFGINVVLPEYLGLGKSVTKGFGVIHHI